MGSITKHRGENESEGIAMDIKRNLLTQGIPDEKVRWLSVKFLCGDA